MPIGLTIFSIALVALGGLALIWHLRQWRQLPDRADLADEDRRFYHQQVRRRMQIAAMLALSGLALLVGGHLISPRRFPTLAVCWWIGTVVLVLWMALLALADIWAIRHYARRRLNQMAIQEGLLRSQLRRQEESLSRHQTHPPAKPDGSGNGHSS